MTTALLILLATVLILAIVAVLHQMITSPFMWVYHMVFDSVGFLVHLLVLTVQAIGEAVTGGSE